jgi:predicted phage-related endonuclease
VIVKTKTATHQISRSNEVRDVIDVKNLKEDHPDIYFQYIRKVEYRKINIKTIKQ